MHVIVCAYSHGMRTFGGNEKGMIEMKENSSYGAECSDTIREFFVGKLGCINCENLGFTKLRFI